MLPRVRRLSHVERAIYITHECPVGAWKLIIVRRNITGQEVFKASLVYECLTSVPFNADIASRYLDYWNDTLKFQTSVSYLKDPPPGYQQPSVDLFDGMTQLQAAVEAGRFANQYEFEVALQLLLTAAHDSHLFLDGGALAVFTFASPFDIVSVSSDGIQPPKVYIASEYMSPVRSKYLSTLDIE